MTNFSFCRAFCGCSNTAASVWHWKGSTGKLVLLLFTWLLSYRWLLLAVTSCPLSQLCGWQQSSSQNTLLASVNKLGFNYVLASGTVLKAGFQRLATNFFLLYPCPELPPSHCWQKPWHTHHVPQLCAFHPWSLCSWDGSLSLTKDSIFPFMQSK